MGSLIHIAEVAALLFVAYCLGWGIGYGARRLAVRLPAVTPTISAERLATARGEGRDQPATLTGLGVGAPVVVASTGLQVAGVVAFPEAALPAAASPVLPPEPVVAPEEPAKLAPPEPTPPMPAATAGHAWAGEMKGRPSPIHKTTLVATPSSDGPLPAEGGREQVVIEFPVEPPAPAAPPPQPATPVIADAGTRHPRPPRVHPIDERIPLPLFADVMPEEFVAPASMPVESPAAPLPPQPAYAAVPEPEAAPPVRVEDAPLPPAEPAARPLPPAPPSGAPVEVKDPRPSSGLGSSLPLVHPAAPSPVAEVGVAVAAAQSAVRQVLAETGIDPARSRQGTHFGKPVGIPHPRNGRRDNLLEIEGISPLDQSTLNNLGIYHFDQVAALGDVEVLWLENHAFARGRIGRESWQPQARSLAARDEAARAR
ncbi:MAG: hypothetical protein ABI697_06900 [Devosia sp.]